MAAPTMPSIITGTVRRPIARDASAVSDSVPPSPLLSARSRISTYFRVTTITSAHRMSARPQKPDRTGGCSPSPALVATVIGARPSTAPARGRLRRNAKERFEGTLSAGVAVPARCGRESTLAGLWLEASRQRRLLPHQRDRDPPVGRDIGVVGEQRLRVGASRHHVDVGRG